MENQGIKKSGCNLIAQKNVILKLNLNYFYKLKFYFIILFTLICFAKFSNAQNFVTPENLTELDQDIKETSGLVNLNGEIWTHNDSGDDPILYQINASNGNIIRTVEIANATNEDWEDITADENFVYIGDVGNNYGDRTDLRIYKISRSALAASDEVYAEIIQYSYSDQTSWEINHNNHDFDCEALISFENNLYLFSKNWVDHQTRCYQLSKQSGTHIAEYQSTYDIECLVTGGEILKAPNRLVLIGYNSNGGSYTWIFEGFNDANFFSGTNTKLIWTSLTQIEGVCQANESNKIYVSSEEISDVLDPTLFFHDVPGDTTDVIEQNFQKFRVYTSNNYIFIEPDSEKSITADIQLLNTSGTVLYKKRFVNESQVQVHTNVSNGIYLLVVTTKQGTNTYKIVL